MKRSYVGSIAILIVSFIAGCASTTSGPQSGARLMLSGNDGKYPMIDAPTGSPIRR